MISSIQMLVKMKKQLRQKALRLFFLTILCGFALNLTAQLTQQGAKLVGTGNVGAARQGQSVVLSADGNTALVGGPRDNTNQGAVWVYTRSGTTWTQQGQLVGTGAIGAARQGSSVALSSDGNTAIVGGTNDDSGQGAVWIFTRSGTTWTQQGAKLVGTGNVGAANQGASVALSADGTTALVGGYFDNSGQGAVWVFTRSGTTWTQQGAKLVGTGNTGVAAQGGSVALSADGNTALVSGSNDNVSQGTVWVFTRSGTTWTQQGSKLIGTGATGTAYQGNSVALSNDGNTALVGGYFDDNTQGAVWVFTRSGTTWTQQGTKLVGTGNTGAALQGSSVALSDDGNTALVGGLGDNSNQGAAWVFAPLALPVELLDFTGTPSVSGNLLTWTTANEVNNKGFSVERLNGNVWQNIGFKTANNKASTYEFTDNTPLTISSYRLRQIDNDGTETLSKIITIQGKSATNKLIIYPNPVSEVLNFVSSDTHADYYIINLLGQTVLQGRANTASINVSALPQGSYVLKMGNAQVKFIKQ
jgi:hypothetical protein